MRTTGLWLVFQLTDPILELLEGFHTGGFEYQYDRFYSYDYFISIVLCDKTLILTIIATRSFEEVHSE